MTLYSPLDKLRKAGHRSFARLDPRNQLNQPRRLPHMDQPIYFADTPSIVCLCGSTRFWKQFQETSLELTMQGMIVLSIGAATSTDDSHFGHLSDERQEAIKTRLDALHLAKIRLADSIYVLNVATPAAPDGYIGVSTRRELAYAISLGREIHFRNPVMPDWLASIPAFDTLAVPTR